MIRVFLIRHGESESNAGLPSADPGSAPLTKDGHRQARQVARVLGQAQPRWEVGEQVHVAAGVVFTTGHAAEHAQVRDPMRGRRSDQVVPVAAHPAAYRAGEPAQMAGGAAQAQRQLEAGRIDQPGEGRDGGLALPGLVRADHALGDACPGG